jgi:copper chaperone
METELKIEGMHCDGCVRAVRNVLGSLEGVDSVAVNLEKGRALIGSAGPLDARALMTAVEDAGYRASLA